MRTFTGRKAKKLSRNMRCKQKTHGKWKVEETDKNKGMAIAATQSSQPTIII
jgi:hypothetical protein